MHKAIKLIHTLYYPVNFSRHHISNLQVFLRNWYKNRQYTESLGTLHMYEDFSSNDRIKKRLSIKLMYFDEGYFCSLQLYKGK